MVGGPDGGGGERSKALEVVFKKLTGRDEYKPNVQIIFKGEDYLFGEWDMTESESQEVSGVASFLRNSISQLRTHGVLSDESYGIEFEYSDNIRLEAKDGEGDYCQKWDSLVS